MWSLAKLGKYHEATAQLCLDYFVANRAQFKPPQALNILWALVKLRHYPDALYSQFVDYAVSQLAHLKPADMATLFYSFGVFEHHPGKAAMAKLLPRMQVRRAARTHARTLWFSYFCFATFSFFGT